MIRQGIGQLWSFDHASEGSAVIDRITVSSEALRFEPQVGKINPSPIRCVYLALTCFHDVNLNLRQLASQATLG